jgi:hypothetical protein
LPRARLRYRRPLHDRVRRLCRSAVTSGSGSAARRGHGWTQACWVGR